MAWNAKSEPITRKKPGEQEKHMVERVDLEAAEEAGKVMMALRQKILDAPIPDDANACAARLKALSLFDVAVILSSPIVQAVEAEPPEAVPMFAAQAKAQTGGRAPTLRSLLRWAKGMAQGMEAKAAKGRMPTSEEWNELVHAVDACLAQLPADPVE